MVSQMDLNRPTSAAVDFGDSRNRRGRDFILSQLSIVHAVESGLQYH